jgi:hypothetical protein
VIPQIDQKPFLSTRLQSACGKLIDARRNAGIDPIQYREAVEALRAQVKVEQEKSNEVFEFINQLLDGISTRSCALPPSAKKSSSPSNSDLKGIQSGRINQQLWNAQTDHRLAVP